MRPSPFLVPAPRTVPPPLALGIAAACLAGCGPSTTSPPDLVPDLGPDLAPSTSCGPGPYVHVHVGVASYVTHFPVVGAVATVEACPGQQFVTDDTGYWNVEMTAGLPFDPRVDARDFIPIRTGQSIATADIDLGAVALFPTDTAKWFPHLGASSPDLLVLTALPAGTKPDPANPCTTKDGITFSVPGHPEAKVGYYGGTGLNPAVDPSLTATGTLGSAEIGGLSATDGPTLQLMASKPGCDVSVVSWPHTGKYKLENGVLSIAGAFMPPVPPP
jgi:hypothetical protein